MTTAVSSSELHIRNRDGNLNGIFLPDQVIQVYGDYANGTRKLFEGTISSVNYTFDGYSKIVLKCMDYGADAFKKTVYKRYTNQTISDIFKDLIAVYLPTHTVTNVTSISTQITISFMGKQLWRCLQELSFRQEAITTFIAMQTRTGTCLKKAQDSTAV